MNDKTMPARKKYMQRNNFMELFINMLDEKMVFKEHYM